MEATFVHFASTHGFVRGVEDALALRTPDHMWCMLLSGFCEVGPDFGRAPALTCPAGCWSRGPSVGGNENIVNVGMDEV